MNVKKMADLYCREALTSAASSSATICDRLDALLWEILLGREPTVHAQSDTNRSASKFDPMRAAACGIAIDELGGISKNDTASEFLGQLGDLSVSPSLEVHRALIGVAVAALVANDAARDRWVTALFGKPHDESRQEILFETLATLDMFAEYRAPVVKAVARASYNNLRHNGPLPTSALILAFIAACRQNGVDPEILQGSLENLFDEQFADDKPRLEAAKPKVEDAGDENGRRTATVKLQIKGTGRFDAGADPTSPFTHGLTQTIVDFDESSSRMPAARRKAFFAALKDGAIELHVAFPKTVSVPSKEVDALRKRVALAWELLTKQLEDVASTHTLVIEGGSRGD